MQDASLQWHSWQTVAHRGTRGKSGASAWLSKLPGPGSPWPQRQRQWRCGGTMMKSVIIVKSVGWGLASWNIHDISILKSHHAFFSHRTNLTGLVMRWILEHWRDLTCLKQGTTLQALLARVQSLPPQCPVLHCFTSKLQCTAGQLSQPHSSGWLRYSVGARRNLSRKVLSPGPGPVPFLSGVSRWG